MKDMNWLKSSLIAHRGLHDNITPENSLEACLNAAKKGYDIEFDLQLTKDNQLAILDTLIQRLEEAAQMKPDTMQYQQAMLQITGQEFDHVLAAINSIFKACWFRQSGMVVFALWFSWIVWLLMFCAGVGLVATDY